MSGILPGSTISPFVAAWLPLVAAEVDAGGAPRLALDLAMGEGRHALPLARAGFVTFGVDRSLPRIQTACRVARDQRLHVHAWAADLETYPLPVERFDLLFCTRYLLRARWADLRRSVKPGGFVIYETFTIHQVRLGRGPSSPDHLLRPGELSAAFADWDVRCSEEVEAPAALARLVARKPATDGAAREHGPRR